MTEPRVKYITGWITADPTDGSVECGDYTDFPVEVTGADIQTIFGKIHEVYYLAKFAQFTANALYDYAYGGPSGVTTGSVTPRVQKSSASGGLSDEALLNGHWTLDTVTYPCYAAALPFLDASYSVDLTPLGIGAQDYRDITTREAGMWLGEESGEFPIWNRMMPTLVGIGSFYTGVGTMSGLDEQGFRTAFSWYSISPSGAVVPPTLPIPYISQDAGGIIYEIMEVLVEFDGRVAIVKADPDDSNFATTNRYFLGIRVRIANTAPSTATSGPIGGGQSATAARYVMRLSSGDLTCPLASDYGSLAGDLVHEVTEWWPYKTTAGVAAFNTATGAPINGGPSA